MGKCKNFCSASIPIRFAYILLWVSFILAILAFSTPVWFAFTSTTGSSGTQGLWNHCYWSSNFMCCGTVGNYYDGLKNTVPTWMQAVRVMLAVTLLTGLLAIIGLSKQSFGSPTRGCGLFSTILCFLTGLVLTAAIVTYAVAVKDDWGSRVDYSFSFFACIISAVGFLVVGAISLASVCCLACRNYYE